MPYPEIVALSAMPVRNTREHNSPVLTSEKLAAWGNSATFYFVWVEVEFGEASTRSNTCKHND